MLSRLMDDGGTGGSLFRNIYRDFLKECDEMYPDMGIHEAYLKFAQIAPLWREVSKLIRRAGEDSNEGLLKEASHILLEIASLEEEAMKLLIRRGTVPCLE